MLLLSCTISPSLQRYVPCPLPPRLLITRFYIRQVSELPRGLTVATDQMTLVQYLTTPLRGTLPTRSLPCLPLLAAARTAPFGRRLPADPQASFAKAQSWVRELQRQADPSTIIMLVGNKSDLASNRKTPRELAEQFAQEEGLLFVEASAKSGEGVEALFMEIGMFFHFHSSLLSFSSHHIEPYLGHRTWMIVVMDDDMEMNRR
jgi:hypothetical protein